MKVRLGLLDQEAITRAARRGIDLEGGYIRNTDERVVIGNRLFLTLGLKHRYMLRSRIVWWLMTGELLQGWKVANLHHKNGDRIDDRLENLEKIGHSEHAREHNPSGQTATKRICKTCQKEFVLPRWRLKESGRGSFCSPDCYKAKPKSEITKQRQSDSLRRAYAEGRR